MSGRNWTMTAAMAVAMVILMVFTSVRVKGVEGEFTEVNSDDYSIAMTVEGVWHKTIGMPDSRKMIYWTGNEVFFAVARNETPNDFTAYLYHSGDGGEIWDDPIRVYTENDIWYMRVEIMIIDFTLFYLLHIVRDYEGYVETTLRTRSLYCYVVPLTDWYNIDDYTPQRMDDEYPGYMPTYQLLGFRGDAYVFWVRSHYMDSMYRRYSGGKWSPTMFLDFGTFTSHMAVITSNLSGEERIHYAYQYYPDNSLYISHSTDGLHWTQASTIWYHSDSMQRLSITEWEGRLHLVVSERNDYDIYHSWSSDGFDWVPFMKIGETTRNDYGNKNPMTDSVAISGSPSLNRLLVAHDSNSGVEMIGSKDNGDSFEVLARFKNDTAFYPNFCSKGVFLMYADECNILTIRRLGIPSSTVPPDDDIPPDDNSTTPPDDNSTTPPDDNSTTPPDDNSTTPPDDNSTTPPDNGTDDGTDDVTPPSDNNPPDEPEMIFMEGGFHEGARIIVRGSGHDPDENDTDLNYTWYIEGMGIVGYGTYLKLELQAGTYTLTLRVADEHGACSETVKTITVKEGSGENGPEKWPEGSDPIEALGFTIALLFLLMIAMAVIMTRMSFLRRQTTRRVKERKGLYISGSSLDAGPSDFTGTRSVKTYSAPLSMTSGISVGPMGPWSELHPDDEVRTGTLGENRVLSPRLLEPPEQLDGIRGAVEAKGFRSASEIESLKRKAEMKKGELPQNLYQEITEILERYGR